MASYDYEEIETYLCIICKELLMDPVVLPCNGHHTACLYCLEKTLDNNKYQCFLCRKSIQSWYRKQRRNKCLVNEELRNEINDKFSDLILKRLNGESLDIVPTVYPKIIKLSNPGEIKRDFESERTQLEQVNEREKDKENKLSQELIKQIMEEENRRRLEEEEKLRKDEEMARQLALQLNKSYSDKQNDVIAQLTLDETLARELARKDSLSTEVDQLTDIVVEQFSSDEVVTRKLANRDTSFNPLWKSKSSPKTDKSKKKQSVSKYGPMDRFVEIRRPRID